MKDLQDKVAIITGASSGIGQATAIHFSSYGAKLVLVARNEAKLDETIASCQKDKVLKIVGDVNDPAVREKIVQSTLSTFGKINILVNNAGIGQQDTIFSIQEDNFDGVMNTNLRSVVFLTKACVPHLVEQKGVIVNVSSLFGTHSQVNSLTYSMSKAALDQFTKCISLELAPKGVRVNSVNPGSIKTNIILAAGFVKTQEESDRVWESRNQLHPLGRIGRSEEVASAIAFLASDQSSFITGELVHVDGGRRLA